MSYVYLAYDNESFKDAVDNTIINSSDISMWVEYAFHDFSIGLCRKFQIYNESGEVIFESCPHSIYTVEMTEREAV